jgi:hypothetical protein
LEIGGSSLDLELQTVNQLRNTMDLVSRKKKKSYLGCRQENTGAASASPHFLSPVRVLLNRGTVVTMTSKQGSFIKKITTFNFMLIFKQKTKYF